MSLLRNIGQFWEVVREVDPAGVEREIRQQLRIRLISSDAALLSDVGVCLFGPSAPGLELCPPPCADAHVHIGVLLVAAGTFLSPEEAVAARDLPLRAGACMVGVVSRDGNPPMLPENEAVADYLAEQLFPIGLTRAEEARGAFVKAISVNAPELRLALGRQFPQLRSLVAAQIILETSTANAQFALLSSLPANVPLLGFLASTAADIFVLTKNQVMLLFKLAGLHGRELSGKRRLVAEITPVVAGALLWRSVARSLVGLLPGVLSAAPKAAVAFVGTFVVGRIALSYYESGRSPGPAARNLFTRQAADTFRTITAQLRPRWRMPRGG